MRYALSVLILLALLGVAARSSAQSGPERSYLPLVALPPPTATPSPTVTPSSTVTATTGPVAPTATATATTVSASPTRDAAQCAAEYPTVCIPPPPPDLDCSEITPRRFVALPPDRHRFDQDGNGIGCESD